MNPKNAAISSILATNLETCVVWDSPALKKMMYLLMRTKYTP